MNKKDKRKERHERFLQSGSYLLKVVVVLKAFFTFLFDLLLNIRIVNTWHACFPLFRIELNAARRVEERSKKANKRSKTVVVGDMEPLLSALPTINVPELIRGSKSSNNR